MKIDPNKELNFQNSLAAAFDDRKLNCYAIVDSAQEKTLLARFKKASLSSRSKCLLPAAIDSGIEDYSPHLLALVPLAADSAIWPELLAEGAQHSARFTLIASELDFDGLWTHLSGFTEIVLPDETEMILAFWDPAILGTMLGNAKDLTLHIKGPVLTERQRARLMKRIASWWYWNRAGQPQQIVPENGPQVGMTHHVRLPLRLTQTQVDMLVEASVPDLVLAHLSDNQPTLLREIPFAEQYSRIRKHLLEARQLKLFGVRDIVNYTCAAIIYGDAIHSNQEIRALLDRVRKGEIDFNTAMDLFPSGAVEEF